MNNNTKYNIYIYIITYILNNKIAFFLFKTKESILLRGETQVVVENIEEVG